MGILICKMTNKDPDFYTLVGPFLCRREIVREVGGPMWDDDEKVWYVAMRGGVSVGVSAIVRSKSAVTLCSAYVRAEDRKSGAWKAMTVARMKDADGLPLRVVANANTEPLYEALGFEVDRRVGGFAHMRKGPR